MTAEQMGKVSRRLRLVFAITTVVFVGVLAVSPVTDYFQETRNYCFQIIIPALTRSGSRKCRSWTDA